MAGGDGVQVVDVRGERGRVSEAGEGVQDHGDAVVGEHGDGGDVVEGAVGGFVEGGPDVCGGWS